MTTADDERYDRSLLARVDERTKAIADDIADMKAAANGFVTHTEFAPIRALVFGAVGLILVSFMGALLYVAGFQPH